MVEPMSDTYTTLTLGLDPGITGTGYALVEHGWQGRDMRNAKARCVYSATIKPGDARDPLTDRLAMLLDGLDAQTLNVRDPKVIGTTMLGAIIVEDATEQYLYRGQAPRRLSTVAALGAAVGVVLGWALKNSTRPPTVVRTVWPRTWYPKAGARNQSHPMRQEYALQFIRSRVAGLPSGGKAKKDKHHNVIMAAGLADWWFLHHWASHVPLTGNIHVGG